MRCHALDQTLTLMKSSTQERNHTNAIKITQERNHIVTKSAQERKHIGIKIIQERNHIAWTKTRYLCTYIHIYININTS